MIRFLLCLVLSLLPLAANAEALRLATWNIEHLRAAVDRGPNPRTTEDFERLQRYAAALNADVIALQEVDGAEAAQRVFPEGRYRYFFSGRNHPQLTGFAVRRGISVTRNPDFTALSLGGDLRRGTDVTVEFPTGQKLRLLAVHLKSGCWAAELDSSDHDCARLAQQIPLLEDWIDKRAEQGIPFSVLGDFNRRFDARGDAVWPELDDGEPATADLARVTQGRESRCWRGEFPLYIDHVALDLQASSWLVEGSFEQLVYTVPETLKDQLSDHCPILVTLDPDRVAPPGTSSQADIIRQLERIESRLDDLESGVGEQHSRD